MKTVIMLALCWTSAALSAQGLDVLGGIPVYDGDRVSFVLAPADGPAVVWERAAQVRPEVWAQTALVPEYVKGWRLPTRAEWNLIVEQAQPDWGLNEVLYWTSEEADEHYSYVCVQPMATVRPDGPEVRHKKQDAFVRFIRSVD